MNDREFFALVVGAVWLLSILYVWYELERAPNDPSWAEEEESLGASRSAPRDLLAPDSQSRLNDFRLRARLRALRAANRREQERAGGMAS